MKITKRTQMRLLILPANQAKGRVWTRGRMEKRTQPGGCAADCFRGIADLELVTVADGRLTDHLATAPESNPVKPNPTQTNEIKPRRPKRETEMRAFDRHTGSADIPARARTFEFQRGQPATVFIAGHTAHSQTLAG